MGRLRLQKSRSQQIWHDIDPSHVAAHNYLQLLFSIFFHTREQPSSWTLNTIQSINQQFSLVLVSIPISGFLFCFEKEKLRIKLL